MGAHRRWADVAVDEVLDVQDRLGATQRLVEEILSDGHVTPQEATRLRTAIATCASEAGEAVTAAERANVAEMVVVSALTVKPINPHLRERAADLGVPVIELPTPARVRRIASPDEAA